MGISALELDEQGGYLCGGINTYSSNVLCLDKLSVTHLGDSVSARDNQNSVFGSQLICLWTDFDGNKCVVTVNTRRKWSGKNEFQLLISFCDCNHLRCFG